MNLFSFPLRDYSPLDPKGAVITQVEEKESLFSFPLRDYSPLNRMGAVIRQVEEKENLFSCVIIILFG